MLRRLLVPIAAVALTLGAAGFAFAQDATPTASPVACASPVAGAPNASPAAIPAASPVAGCGTPVSAEIDAVDIAFQPKDVTVPANTPVELTLINKGLALHNFGIDALHINIDLVPGETRVISVVFPAGDYAYYCDIPGHAAAGMAGVLHAEYPVSG